MTIEHYRQLLENEYYETIWIDLLNASGWAGMLHNGNIVDRRYFPEAIPIQKNSLFGVEEPRELPK